jgi:uncharacterized membrane protein YgcG
MHTHMHRIQLNAYLICTLYIGYAHTCICMYLTVSACILAHWSCIKCICACMSYTYMPAYMQIHTHMHCLKAMKAMHMCMYFCHEYMHMYIFESSAYLYVSDCISRSHTFTYASILWFLLRQIGRPQQRATREFSCEFSHLPPPPSAARAAGTAAAPPRPPCARPAPAPRPAGRGAGRERRRSPSAAGGGLGVGEAVVPASKPQRRRGRRRGRGGSSWGGGGGSAGVEVE